MPPLAERLRPNTFENYFGQKHLVGSDSILRKHVESGHLSSFILWGPPGVGKTTLAKIIAQTMKRTFFELSAINSGVKDVRETIQKAKGQQFFNKKPPILFIDEIHRFSKSQQDSLLGAVEKGIVTLIGATTENPSFEVISALLSRCQIYVLQHLEKEELINIIDFAIAEDLQFQKREIDIKEHDALLRFSGGDVRKLYNALEIVVEQFESDEKVVIDNELVAKSLQNNLALYDKSGEQHYDIISAFIKSIRGSDPNAALYYLARMIEGGEDPKFLCRRMVISASEDIGLANPNALLIANACMDAVMNIGMPEGRIPMSQAAIYLASSPKSNSAYLAIKNAQEFVKQTGNLPVPLHLRNAPTKLMKQLDYGKDYKYAHDHQDAFVDLEYLPESASGTRFWNPINNPTEQKIRERLRLMWKGRYGF